MSQFNSTVANLANNYQQSTLNQKKKQTQDRLNNPGNRTSLRDRRRQSLLDQGIDPDQLDRGIRQDRGNFKRLMRESRRAFKAGDTATGERLRGEADALKYDINDRFKLSRPTLRDLPVDQQAAQRAESRAQLNAQLPNIAANARQQEAEALSRHTGRLARVGRQAHQLEFGTPAPAGVSEGALADLARTASPEVLARVTRGVGLPQAPQGGQADRLALLAASGGVAFSEFTPQARQDDPSVLDRVRTAQAQGQLDRQAGLAIRGNQRQASVAASEAAIDDQRLRIDQNDAARAGLNAAADTAGDDRNLDVESKKLDLDRKRAETDLVELQIEQATQELKQNLKQQNISLDANLASSAAATITTRLGKALNKEDQRAIGRAVESINTMLNQYDGDSLRDVASHFLAMFTEGGVDFSDIDFDSQSLLGGRSFFDSNAADENERKVTELVNKLRFYASGQFSQPRPSNQLDAQEERLARLPG